MPAWREAAACGRADTNLFMPETVREEAAKAFCSICRVRQDCLGYALSHNLEGIWGGTTLDERMLFRKELRSPVRIIWE